MTKGRTSAAALALCAALCALATATASSAAETRWWKGNLHTHTLWSDGDEFPEVVLAQYKERGYHFVALSDHNTLPQGTRTWNPWQVPGGPAVLARYLERLGEAWVDLEERVGQRTVRLKGIDECRQLLEEPGRFLILQAEEITDRFEDRPVHLNATNLVEFIPPQGGSSVLDVMQRTVDAVLAQRERTGEPIMVHLNHPNFVWGISLQDLIELRGERFFEVYNGHSRVNNEGDAVRPSTERMWDVALSLRAATGRPLLFGLAVDDGHDYQEIGIEHLNAFRGWVMVRAESLEPRALVEALERGDFYASTGVELRKVTANEGGIGIEIEPRDGATYLTRFIGTRRAGPGEDSERTTAQYGAVLAEVPGLVARYDFRGDELYVRATVVSNRPQQNPNREGDVERAWTQPVSPPQPRSNQSRSNQP